MVGRALAVAIAVAATLQSAMAMDMCPTLVNSCAQTCSSMGHVAGMNTCTSQADTALAFCQCASLQVDEADTAKASFDQSCAASCPRQRQFSWDPNLYIAMCKCVSAPAGPGVTRSMVIASSGGSVSAQVSNQTCAQYIDDCFNRVCQGRGTTAASCVDPQTNAQCLCADGSVSLPGDTIVPHNGDFVSRPLALEAVVLAAVLGGALIV